MVQDDSLRQYSILDAVLERINTIFRIDVKAANIASLEEYPGIGEIKSWESQSERLNVVALMRINHAGEVSAQGLYLGQALFSRNHDIFKFLVAAASEERRHLVWCSRRIQELGGSISIFTPAWFIGSFFIGVTVSISGDPRNLGFVEETEKQVSQHLSGHLGRIPPDDKDTLLVLRQMRQEEIKHGMQAESLGGVEPPELVKKLMSLAALAMKEVAHKI